MPKCSYCRENYEFPMGLTLALNDGTILHFCSSKCRKNSELGRNKKKLKWITKAKLKEEPKIENISESKTEKSNK